MRTIRTIDKEDFADMVNQALEILIDRLGIEDLLAEFDNVG